MESTEIKRLEYHLLEKIIYSYVVPRSHFFHKIEFPFQRKEELFCLSGFLRPHFSYTKRERFRP